MQFKFLFFQNINCFLEDRKLIKLHFYTVISSYFWVHKDDFENTVTIETSAKGSCPLFSH